jgi:NADH dehydrogenase/NADH:ubiquinone oxidoreductase subunit G
MMRESRVDSELSKKWKASQDVSAVRANVSELLAASRVEVPVIKEPLLSEVGEYEQENSQAGKKPKRSARQLARAAEERQIIIQQLMAGVLEKSKREKLLRLLIELGISEIEYRDLVAKLGEMEARRMAEQAKAETKHAIEIPAEPPRDTESGPIEVPAMKSGAPKTNPTTAVPVTEETRAEMYARLRGARGKGSH